MGSTTTNYNLYKPTVGEVGWGTLFNTSTDTVDTQMKTNADAVAVNVTAIGLNTTHRTSNGSDHSYLDQSVVSGATPTFTATNITGVPAASILAGTFGTGAFTFDNTVSGITTLTATTLAGTLSTAAQASVTSLGTLTGLTMGGDLAMQANDITMTGTLGITGARVLQGWFIDITCTNAIAADITGNAATATSATSATTATNIIVTDDESSATSNAVLFVEDLDGSTSIGAKSDGTLNYTPSTGVLAATGFSGTLTGNVTGDVTGDVTGSSGSCTGNAATATTATNIVVTDDESSATSNAVLFVEDLDGSTSIGAKSDGTLNYTPSTGVLAATGFSGALTGNVTGDVSGNAGTVTTNANLTGAVTSVGNATTMNSGLNDLTDVIVATPVTDNILKYNGAAWVNASGVGVSGSGGVTFYLDDTNILPIDSENLYDVATLYKAPAGGAEEVDAIACTNNTVLGEAYLYDTGLGATSIDAGEWVFNTYASVSSVLAARVSSITRNIYHVVVEDTITVTTTDVSEFVKTATASGGTPFASDDDNASIVLCGFLQTPKGLYQILSYTSATEVTIAVPTGYSNETTVAFSTWKRKFGASTGEITSLTMNYALYTSATVQPAITIAATDKLALAIFGVSNNTTTVNFVHNGTEHYSHFVSPLLTRHNDLVGLQGGAADEYYHATAAEYTILGNTSGSNTGDNTVCTSGTATTAETLATARAINGVDFNGSIPITVTAAADTLSGTELKSTVVTSSLTSVGTLTSMTTSGDISDGTTALTVTELAASNIQFIISGGGSAIATGVAGYIEVPFACTIQRVTMLADQSCTAVVDIWGDSYANYPPVDDDSITAAAPPTITTDTDSQDATLTDWTTAIAAGDILGYNVDSNDNAELITISLKVVKV